MRGRRLINQIGFLFINNPFKRGDYIRKRHIFHSCGEYVSFQPRKIPLYGELISIGNNVVIASNVSFCTHDAMSIVFNRAGYHTVEKVGCIEIGNNCFIGANSILMYDTHIGDNSIVAAGAVVTRDVPPGSVVGGVPAKVIGRTESIIDKYKMNYNISTDKESLSDESVAYLWMGFSKE